MHSRCLRLERAAGLEQGYSSGQPDTIPVAETDLIFSAMTEEMGLIFALCLILDLRELLCDVFEYCDGIA